MYTKFFLIFSIVGGTWAACPPTEEILPCTCDETLLKFYCSQQNDPVPWDIKATFDKVVTLIPPDFVFNDLTIAITNLETIPAGAVQSIKFNKIYIFYNDLLTYIHPDAFGETANVTTILSITENPSLTNEGEGHTERDLFEVLSKFTAATEISIQNNKIVIIPDEGFGPLPNLQRLTIGPGGRIARIGSRAFSGLPNLTFIDLNTCEIGHDEISEDAFEGMSPNVEIVMEWNHFDRLPEVPFKGLLDNVKHIDIGGRQCVWLGFWYCTDVRYPCNEEAEWICQDVEKYQPKVKGYFCVEEGRPRYDDIWKYCAGQMQ